MQDLTGKTFHCLKVTGLEKTPAGAMWLCECSCGKEAYAKTYDLLNEKKKSCGHLRTEHNKRYADQFLRTKKKLLSASQMARRGDFGHNLDDSLDELSSVFG